MANVTCTVDDVQAINDLGNDTYELQLAGQVINSSAGPWMASVVVSKQPTTLFRRRIRDAIVAHIFGSIGETVTFIVWPDLQGEDVI